MDPEPLLPHLLFQSQYLYELLAVLILLLMSGLVSGSEVAYFSISKKDLENYREAYPEATERIETLLRDKKSLLATILILNNFINILIVVLLADISEHLPFSPMRVFGSYDLSGDMVRNIFDLVFITFIILLFGEIIPKVYAQKYPFDIALKMVRPLSFFKKILKPLSVPLMGMTTVLENVIKPEEFSVDQLSEALEITSEDKETSQEEQKILEGIVNFGNSVAREIMTPRVDMFAINEDSNFEEVKTEILEHGYSRVPIYSDNEDSLKGILYAKDLIPYLSENSYNWQSLCRKPIYVPESKKLDDLLADFQRMKTHIAIVVDEYGGTSGLITLEDIIEEIVGEISDEFDDDEVRYTKIDEDTYVFEGKTNIKDFLRIIDAENEDLIEEAKGEAETIAGFVLELIEQFPHKNQKVSFHNFTFTIESLDRKRIKTIKVQITPENEKTED